MKRRGWTAVIVTLISVWLAGCAPTVGREPSAPFFDGADELGRHVVLARRPERIVSMNISTDEILLDLAEPERVVAVSWWAVDEGISCVAERAKTFPILRSRSPEAVLAMKPDLVLTTNGTESEVLTALEELGVSVFVSKNPTRVAEVFPRVERIGEVIGSKAKAAALVKELRARLSAVHTRVADIPEAERPVVMAFAFSKPFGKKGMLFDDMCREAGFKNGVAIAMEKTEGYPLSKEQVVAVNPDIFLMPVWSSNHQDAEAYREQMLGDPAYREVNAVKNGRLFSVEDRYRYSSSQYVIEAVERLAATVYPERFGK